MLTPSLTGALQFVLPNLAAESIAVNSEDLRCAALVTVRAFQDTLDEFLFKLGNGLFEQDAPLDHKSDE